MGLQRAATERNFMRGSAPGIARPRLWRLALGFLVAPLAGAAFLGAVVLFEGAPPSSAFTFMLISATYGYPLALVFGIPAYVALHRWVRPRPAVLALVGGVIAVLPWLWVMYWPSLQEGVSSQSGDCVSKIDGVTTWCGHLLNAQYLAIVFAAGGVGGLAFWLCTVWREPRFKSEPAPRPQPRPPSASPSDYPSTPPPHSS